MNNKKCLDLSKGWLLCESKSFPGKLYYFNVRNGEAVWTLNDATTTIKNNNSTENIPDKSYNYPEPTTLPGDLSSTYQNIGTSIKPEIHTNLPTTSNFQPISGQPVFPKYSPNIDTKITKIVWTPIQVPMPVCWNVEAKKPVSDKITQTSEYKEEILVQTCDVPLSQRFVNNQRNNINKATNFETSTPMTLKTQVTNPNHFFNESNHTVFQPKSPGETKCNGKSVFTFGDKVESGKTEIKEMSETQGVLNNLDSNDLRFRLLAKRKKSVDFTCEPAVERNQPKTESELPTNKKVTFDLVDDVTDGTISQLPHDDIISTSKDQSVSTTDLDKLSTKLNSLWFKDIQTFKEPNFLENAQMLKNNKIWFIAVDTEVLLLDYEAIETIVKADPTCKLLIPHMVQADIEAICMGTCDGQQRVLNARQITRKLAIPPPYFLVEPPNNQDCFEMTTESILNCCMKAIKSNFYVVLVTNDPHLKNRASILNIPSYKLNEIKNGAHLKPDLTDVNVKNSRQNDDTDKKTEFDKKRSNSNFNVDTVKKQLFMDNDDLIGFDRLMDVTKPKYSENCDNGSDSESIGSDISRDVQNLNLKSKAFSHTENIHRNPFLPQNGRKNIIPTVFDSTNLNNKIPNSKFEFEKPLSIWNFNKRKKEQETLFGSNPISNFKTPNTISDFESLNLKDKNRNPFLSKDDNINRNQIPSIFDPNNLKMTIPNSKFENQLNNWNFDIQKKDQETVFSKPTSKFKLDSSKIKSLENTGIQDYGSKSLKIKVQTSSQQRIKKILDHVTNADDTETFEIPQPLLFKNRTQNTGCIGKPLQNSKFRMFLNLESLDENLKRFSVTTKSIGDRINNRIEEFICVYIQIMEDVLNSLLKKNNLKDMLPPTTLQETLNCIKMLYNEHENIREVIYRLTLCIEKCVTDKGHLIKCMKPDNFMKMLGHGVLLILALQTILPLSEELKDAETSLSTLLTVIESDSSDTSEDPLKTPPVRRSDVDEKYEFRPNFIKHPSFVLEYLKKHFNEWSNYDEADFNNQNINNNSDVKVLRTVGKNLNLLKIDKNKSISMTQNATEGDKTINNKNDSQIFTFLGYKPTSMNNNNFKNTTEIINDKTIQDTTTKDTKIGKTIDKVTENKIVVENSQTDTPKVIESVTKIDENEKKLNKQPLDLDLLDYSETYEPSSDYDYENNSLKENDGTTVSKNSENPIEDNKIVNLHYMSDNAVCDRFENFRNDEHEKNFDIEKSYKHENAIEKAKKIDFEGISETFTEKCDESGVFNDAISDLNNDFCGRNNNDGCDSSVLVKDDVTNDSGFENESTCAHITIKIFFNELSTTFKAVNNFITNFSEEIQKCGLDEKNRNANYQKATKCLENMEAIILRLESIIKRETEEVTVLKTLLLKAGLEATNDKRVTRYRQIVIKCLQQALILENALKIIISTTLGDVDAISCCVESIHSRYFNIFDD